ncbi:hypothetical protein NDU88_005886 [Pleurodeles waltl]|uniref:Uncharacterized protein n=1 Tax=Pleurodeles waltl TaxID=8319 RepID=A0AAV7X0U6_PLEWA|nr:hypothetical protein NDU88_005886 [Pleurodeles waltl]
MKDGSAGFNELMHYNVNGANSAINESFSPVRTQRKFQDAADIAVERCSFPVLIQRGVVWRDRRHLGAGQGIHPAEPHHAVCDYQIVVGCKTPAPRPSRTDTTGKQ